jgi:hypothetical protein
MAAWIATGLFAGAMALSGIAYVIGARVVLDGIRPLGYPDYFLRLLGVAKLLGVVGLFVPRMPRVREWAYAGFTFDLIAAIVSHLVTGTAAHAPAAMMALALMSASYVLRRRVTAGRQS